MSSNTIDRISILVSDVEAAAAWWRQNYGLGVVSAGELEVLGVEKHIIPLNHNTSVVELLKVCSPAIAPSGVKQVEERGNGLLCWWLCCDDAQACADRINSSIAWGSNTFPDGTTFTADFIGIQAALASHGELPAFIHYDFLGANRHKEHYERAKHDRQPAGIAWVEVGGSATRLREYTDRPNLPVRTVQNASGFLGFALAMADGSELVFHNSKFA